MFRFVSKLTPPSNWTSHLVNAYYSTSFQNGTQHSLAVRYLMNEFGFSMEKAVFASSKYVINFKNPYKPASVIFFFKTQGFTDSQIKKMVAAYPRILSSKPQKTLLPKILFLRSKGFSQENVAKILTFIPEFFRRSLKNCIVPSFNFIKDFIGSQIYAIFAISDCPRILLEVESHVKPNIEILLEAGMSQSAIARLMESRPSIFVSGRDKLKESVKQVQSMNMDPESCGYGLALWILAVTRRRRSTWDKRMESYKRWGCSENEVLRSAKTCPNLMKISEERLNGIMSLFVNEIGWESSEVVKRYFMFTLSLNKRLIPRWSVYQELLYTGLIKKKVCLSRMFKMKEDLFCQKFLNPFKDEAPLLLLKLEMHVKPNTEILLGAGMSRSAIERLLKNRPSIFVGAQEKLKESVKQVQNMNMDPESCNYGLALWILTVTRRSTWDKRMEAFKRWGCSEDDVLRSFKLFPFIMIVSEEKLNGIMSLFVHEIGWEASEVVKRYFMFTLSLNKRMIPRWSVYQLLLSKGLVKNVKMSTMFHMKEDQFLKMFVNCYKDEAPLLLKIYTEKQALK